MKRSLITPKRVLVLVVAVLVITSLLPSSTSAVIARVPRTVVMGLLIPTRVLVRPLATSLRPARAAPPELGENQIQAAMTYISQLQQQRDMLKREVQRLTQSKQLLDLGGVRMEPARVAELAGTDAHPLLSIDKGTRAGVRPNLAVVSGTGLVGQVVSATALSAQVQLITAAGARLQVRIAPPRAAAGADATHETQIQWDAKHGYFYTDEGIDVPIHKGDVVQLADERWQFNARGFFVGTVTKVARHPTDPLSFHRIIITAALPLKTLTRVTVLVPVEQ